MNGEYVLIIVWDMSHAISTKYLVVQPNPRDYNTYLQENYVPRGMMKKHNEIFIIMKCY